MKKTFYIFLLLCLIIPCNTSYANQTSPYNSKPAPLEYFEITRGLDWERETTFDETRTISGVSDVNSEITIIVYEVIYNIEHDYADYTEKNRYELTVGPSGLFSETVDLGLGENYVQITAVKGNKKSVVEAAIKRKPGEIKLELNQMKALPGQRTSGATTK